MDWNWNTSSVVILTRRSPPTRVVWIEIKLAPLKLVRLTCHHPHGWCGLKFRVLQNSQRSKAVTTHTGGVDWNMQERENILLDDSHHPHGWCGLKLWIARLNSLNGIVTTHTGGVDWNLTTYVIPHMVKGHHPHGWCGLKFFLIWHYLPPRIRHHPHGWCGLK